VGEIGIGERFRRLMQEDDPGPEGVKLHLAGVADGDVSGVRRPTTYEFAVEEARDLAADLAGASLVDASGEVDSEGLALLVASVLSEVWSRSPREPWRVHSLARDVEFGVRGWVEMMLTPPEAE
jgi:hypothetical protein